MGFANGTLLLSPPACSSITCLVDMKHTTDAKEPVASGRNSAISSLVAWETRWRAREAMVWSVAAPEPMRAPSGSGKEGRKGKVGKGGAGGDGRQRGGWRRDGGRGGDGGEVGGGG